MNLLNRGRASESGRHAREGRLLALFNARPDAATAADVALRRHGAETISIEREWIDGMQAIRAAWPVAAQGRMNEAWLRQVLHSVDLGERDVVRANPGTVQRVAIFVSSRDHCIADLMQRSWHGTLHCEIAEADQLALIESHRVDLIVLARYMQILSPAFVERYPGRIINIHHALLPAFAGAIPYQRAIERGVKFIVATAHYVTAKLDAGPIIEQEVLRVTHRDDDEALRHKGAELERMTLTRAVHLHIEDGVLPVNDRVVVFEGRATRREAIQERQVAHDAVPEKVAARHWLTVEWPMSELQKSLPDTFPRSTAPSGVARDRATHARRQ
ncbi:MAG: formyltransferase family protein [Caldimonas sp.]